MKQTFMRHMVAEWRAPWAYRDWPACKSLGAIIQTPPLRYRQRYGRAGAVAGAGQGPLATRRVIHDVPERLGFGCCPRGRIPEDESFGSHRSSKSKVYTQKGTSPSKPLDKPLSPRIPLRETEVITKRHGHADQPHPKKHNKSAAPRRPNPGHQSHAQRHPP